MMARELRTWRVVTAHADEPIARAAQRMRDQHVGDLVVVEDLGGAARPIGMVTDRDLVVRVVAAGADAAALRVRDVMSGDVMVIEEHVDVTEVLRRMVARGVRRVPVTDEAGRLQGILSYDDLVEWMAEQMTELVAIMRQGRRLEHERSMLERSGPSGG